MNTAYVVRPLFATATMLATAGAALAQAAPPPSNPLMSSPDPGAAQGGWIMAAVLVIALLAIVGVLVRIFDLHSKRESEAVHLQAQISDALLREPNLFGLPVTPTAHAPLWSGTPVTVKIAGEVPDPSVREAVLRIARAEAMRIRPDFEIVDRLNVPPAVRAA